MTKTIGHIVALKAMLVRERRWLLSDPCDEREGNLAALRFAISLAEESAAEPTPEFRHTTGYRNRPDLRPEVGDVVIFDGYGGPREVTVASMAGPNPHVVNCMADGQFCLTDPSQIDFVRRAAGVGLRYELRPGMPGVPKAATPWWPDGVPAPPNTPPQVIPCWPANACCCWHLAGNLIEARKECPIHGGALTST